MTEIKGINSVLSLTISWRYGIFQHDLLDVPGVIPWMLSISIAEKLSLITDSFAEGEDEVTAEMLGFGFEDVTTESSFDFETDLSLGKSSCEEGFGCELVDSQSGSSLVGRQRDCLSEQATGGRTRYESECSVQPSVELGPVKNVHQCLVS